MAGWVGIIALNIAISVCYKRPRMNAGGCQPPAFLLYDAESHGRGAPYFPSIIQILRRQKLRQQIRYLNIVEIGEWEMRIAGDAYLRQVHNRCVAAVPVDGIGENFRQLQFGAPLIHAIMVGRLRSDVVAIVNRDYS